MYDFISLKVKCLKCEKSLMDTKTLVDNMPGVKLNISFDDQKGVIHLSSIYGSYNYTTNLKIPPGIEAEFSCPHCKEIFTSDLKCEECSAHMVPLGVDGERGIVRICSRAGCKKHTVEFDDLPHALEYFHMIYDYGESGRHGRKDLPKVADSTAKPRDDKEIIQSGTFLRAYCPHCEESFYQNEAIEFKVRNSKGEEGILRLSPYLNVFTNESTFYIPEGELVKELICPHCDISLIQKDGKCELCGSPIVGIHIAALSKIIDFFFCSKKGCHWHGMSKEDIDDIILEDSDEW